jgi:hypothetical protein
VFVIGIDHQVYGSKGSAGYFLVAPGQVRGLSVEYTVAGTLELFVTGLDNQVWAVTLDASGQTSTSGGYFLVAVGQQLGAQPGQNSSGSPDVFVLGLDHQVWAVQLDASGRGSGAYALTTAGTVAVPPAGLTSGAALDKVGVIEIDSLFAVEGILPGGFLGFGRNR